MSTCKAIISTGRNAGNLCSRTDCFIAGHDKYNLGKGKCRAVISRGKNKGLECGRLECGFHYNIADFLELPKYFRDVVEWNKYFFTPELYYKMMRDYKNLNTIEPDSKDVFVDIIKENLDLTHRSPKEAKQIIILNVYSLLDTPVSNFLINGPGFKKFKDSSDKKLVELFDDNKFKYPIFSQYLRTNFESGKKFFSVEKNLEDIKATQEMQAAVLKDRYRLCFVFLCVLVLVIYFK